MTASNPDACNQFSCCDNRTLTTLIASYVVENVADLRAMATSLVQENEVAQTLGYYMPGDGGGDFFYWSPTEATTDSGGHILKPADRTVGRWKSLSPECNVKKFGAVANGTTNDSGAINLTVAAANTLGVSIEFPEGLYLVTFGAISEIHQSILASKAFFKAADATDSALFTVNYQIGRPIVAGTYSYIVDIGGMDGFVQQPSPPVQPYNAVGTGLLVKWAARCSFKIRNAQSLKYGIHLQPQSGGIMFENDFWIKSDSCNVGLQITTDNSSSSFQVDANYFYMGSSFNHSIACVRSSAGTLVDHSTVGSNTFEHEVLEIAYPDSDGIVLTGLSINNRFIIRNQRGINGTGKYARTDANSSNNYWQIAVWEPQNWSFASQQTKNTLRAAHGAGSGERGRSLFFAADVAGGVSTTIPSSVGDVILNDSSPWPVGWRCIIAGTPGTWSPFTPSPAPVVNSATYTVTPDYPIVHFTGPNCTVTLPSVSTYSGLVIELHTYGASSLTSASSNIVDLSGAVTNAILPATAGKWARIQSDGTYWRMIAAN